MNPAGDPAPLTSEEVEYLLNNDLFFFAEEAPLTIKDKQGQMVHWVPNKAQRYMQFRAEDQKRRRGWVRILLIKGRQQGGSTWTEMRFYHRVRRGHTTALVISHSFIGS